MMLEQSASARIVQYLTFKNLLLLTSAYIIWNIVYQIVYYRFFHPLRKFPGPFWASVTRLWLAYHNIKADETYVEEDMHKKLGPVLRISPTLLLVSDAKQLPVIYHRRANKTAHYVTGAFGETESLFNMRDHFAHAQSRRIASTPYSFSNIKKMEPLVDGMMRKWISKLDCQFASTYEELLFSAWTTYAIPSV